jgi:hypothetical protein
MPLYVNDPHTHTQHLARIKESGQIRRLTECRCWVDPDRWTVNNKQMPHYTLCTACCCKEDDHAQGYAPDLGNTQDPQTT